MGSKLRVFWTGALGGGDWTAPGGGQTDLNSPIPQAASDPRPVIVELAAEQLVSTVPGEQKAGRASQGAIGGGRQRAAFALCLWYLQCVEQPEVSRDGRAARNGILA